MILNSVLNVFNKKRPGIESPSKRQEIVLEKVASKDYDAIAKKLMDRYAQFRSICRQERIETEKTRSWKNTGNHKLQANDCGLYVLRDESGRVVKTRDAMRRVREYRYDDNGTLQVNKYGVWNKIENGRLSDTGTLIWRSNERETYECLDATTICIAFSNESLIAHNEKTGEEVSMTMSGDIRHVVRKDGVERYRCFRQDKLSWQAETFETPTNTKVATMAGIQELRCVSRIEKQYSFDGQLSKVTYTFYDKQSNQRAVKMSLKCDSGEINLSKVQNLENLYENGHLCETLYELAEPVTITRDQQGEVSLIRGISKVRSYQVRDGVSTVVFTDRNGDENLFFPEV